MLGQEPLVTLVRAGPCPSCSSYFSWLSEGVQHLGSPVVKADRKRASYELKGMLRQHHTKETMHIVKGIKAMGIVMVVPIVGKT